MTMNWHQDDGIALEMVNDVHRNQFYWHMLSNTVRDQVCTDVGFGTGLLSMMALGCGARHITAWESDPIRYQWGRRMIRELGYEHVITLHEGHCTHDDITTPVVFHEIMGRHIWDEGCWDILPPPQHARQILPQRYITELWAVPCDHTMAQGLIRPLPRGDRHQHFQPAVPTPARWQQWCGRDSGTGTTAHTAIARGLHQISGLQQDQWGHNTHHHMICQQGRPVAHHAITHAQDTRWLNITWDLSSHTTDLPCMILQPRFRVEGGGHHMYLDQGHWYPADTACVVFPSQGRVTLRQDWHTGRMQWIHHLVT